MEKFMGGLIIGYAVGMVVIAFIFVINSTPDSDITKGKSFHIENAHYKCSKVYDPKKQ